MKFTPMSKSEREFSEVPLLDDGEYPFKVKRATESESAKGNAMLVVELDITDGMGTTHSVKDYLLPEHARMAWKFHDFLASIGFADVYERGELEPEVLSSLAGRAQIGTQKATDDFPARNIVSRYMAKASKAKKEQPSDDDIPF